MSTLSAHNLTKTMDCKAPGCAETAVAARGRYAGLCERHSKEKQKVAAAPGGAGRGEREQAIRDVLAIAKDIDRQARVIDKLRTKAEAALRLVKDAQIEHARSEARYLAACRAAGLQGDAE